MEKKSSGRGTSRVVGLSKRIVSSNTFDWIITGVILLQAIALAIEATPAILSIGKDVELLEAGTFSIIQSLVIAVFIVEARTETDCSISTTTKVFQGPMELLRFCNHNTVRYTNFRSIFNDSKASQTSQNNETRNQIQ